jgi:hypothetical protein
MKRGRAVNWSRVLKADWRPLGGGAFDPGLVVARSMGVGEAREGFLVWGCGWAGRWVLISLSPARGKD